LSTTSFVGAKIVLDRKKDKYITMMFCNNEG